jgi:hypothetical protein
MDSIFIWAQVIGFIAVTMNVLIWQIKKPERIIAAYIPTNLLWTIQYLMIGGLIGALISFLSVIRDISFLSFAKKHHNHMIYLTLTCTVIIGIYQYEYFIDLLPILGIIAFNVGLFKKDNRGFFARCSLINSFAWLIYCVYLLSIPGVLSSVFSMTSVIIGMARYEEWSIGKCYRSFPPSILKSLFSFPTPQTYP